MSCCNWCSNILICEPLPLFKFNKGIMQVPKDICMALYGHDCDPMWVTNKKAMLHHAYLLSHSHLIKDLGKWIQHTEYSALVIG